jgi:hypothetical protein
MAHPALAPFYYPRRVALEACPFCRDLFEKGEASECPTCGIELASVGSLAPSPTLRHESDEWDEDLGPEHDSLPWSFLGRGRGALVLLSFVGIGLFLLPWIDMTLPDTVSFSGWALARRMGWSWGALAAWVVLVPTIGSRRSVNQLRGARVAAAFLAAIPAITAGVLLAFPPRSGLIPIRFHFDWPLYATLVVSLVSVAVGVRLGGRVDVLVAKPGAETARSSGATLH